MYEKGQSAPALTCFFRMELPLSPIFFFFTSTDRECLNLHWSPPPSPSFCVCMQGGGATLPSQLLMIMSGWIMTRQYQCAVNTCGTPAFYRRMLWNASQWTTLMLIPSWQKILVPLHFFPPFQMTHHFLQTNLCWEPRMFYSKINLNKAKQKNPSKLQIMGLTASGGGGISLDTTGRLCFHTFTLRCQQLCHLRFCLLSDSII